MLQQSPDVVWIKDPVDVAIPAAVQKDGSVKILWGRRQGEKDLQVKGCLDKLVHCTELSLEPKDNLVSSSESLVPGSETLSNAQVNVSELTEELLLHILRVRYHEVSSCSILIVTGGSCLCVLRYCQNP